MTFNDELTLAPLLALVFRDTSQQLTVGILQRDARKTFVTANHWWPPCMHPHRGPCVRERERERESEYVCVCVCVCEREREIKRECVCVREREREMLHLRRTARP